MKPIFRKTLCLLLCLSILGAVLAGCVDDPTIPDATQPPVTTEAAIPETGEPTPETEVPTEAETQPATEATETTEAAETTEATEAPTESSGFASYLETVYLADLPIFSGPSYDDSYVGIVEESGVYTIVEEAWDYEGNLWGRLKSGAGWINLTDSRLAKEQRLPVSAGYASQRLLSSGAYEQCIADESEYAVKIALRFYEDVTDVCLSSLVFDGEEFVVADTVCAFPELTEEKPLVVWLSFPGDMSCYGLYLTDSSGQTHRYTISISGRNGLVVLAEHYD